MKVDIRFGRNVIFCKIGPKLIQNLERYLTICQTLLYTKPNQHLMPITTPNGFKIGPSATKL